MVHAVATAAGGQLMRADQEAGATCLQKTPRHVRPKLDGVVAAPAIPHAVGIVLRIAPHQVEEHGLRLGCFASLPCTSLFALAIALSLALTRANTTGVPFALLPTSRGRRDVSTIGHPSHRLERPVGVAAQPTVHHHNLAADRRDHGHVRKV